MIKLTMPFAGRTYHFEIDGRYRHRDDLGLIMVAFKEQHVVPHEEFGWHEMFKEVFAIAKELVPGALRNVRRMNTRQSVISSPPIKLSPVAFNAMIASPNQGTASQLTQAQTNEISVSSPQYSQVSPIIGN